MIQIKTRKSGPFFVEGKAEKEFAQAEREWTRAIAVLGAAEIRVVQNATFRVQTPYARLQTEARPNPPGWKIWDQELAYGPWLEGTGSRNKTSRFKGYRIWRTMTGRLKARAVSIGQPIIAHYVRRVN